MDALTDKAQRDRTGRVFALLAHWFETEQLFTAGEAARAAGRYPPLYGALEAAGCRVPRSANSVACWLRRHSEPEWGWQTGCEVRRVGKYDRVFWHVRFVAPMPEGWTA